MFIYLTFIGSAAIAAIGFAIANARIWIKILTIVIVVGLCIIQSKAYHDQARENQVLKESGILKSLSVTLLSPAQELHPTLKIGYSNTFLVYTGPSYGYLIQAFEDVGLTIWVANGEMKLSTKIRDNKGELIAEIIANEWRIKKDKLWDLNYNQNALEVKNAAGDVVMQVVMHEDCLQFAARMYSSSGNGLAIGGSVVTEQDLVEHEQGKQVFVASVDGPTEVRVGDTVATIEIRPNPPGIPLKLKIDPIFRYPSDHHFGELLNQ